MEEGGDKKVAGGIFRISWSWDMDEHELAFKNANRN